MDNAEKYRLNAAAYDEIAEIWHSYRKDTPVNKCVEEFCALLPHGARVLDAGCGTGYPVSAYLSGLGFSVTGVDPSEKMLEKAKCLNLANADFVKSDFLGFQTNETFDAIIALDCLWYIESERQHEIYAKASSLLKKGGCFMLTHGSVTGETSGEMMGKTFYYAALCLSNVAALLNANGFDVIREESDYAEPTTGTRDLLIFARKRND